MFKLCRYGAITSVTYVFPILGLLIGASYCLIDYIEKKFI